MLFLLLGEKVRMRADHVIPIEFQLLKRWLVAIPCVP
jgi:hypothetical protein